MAGAYFRRIWFWMIAATVLTLIINALLPFNSQFVETYYSLGVFKGFRVIWDHTIGLSPIPLIYVLLVFLLFYLTRPFFTHLTRKAKFLRVVKRLILTVCSLLLGFYWMWGFNYKRIDIRQTLGIEKVVIQEDDIFATYLEVSDSLMSLRSRLPESMDWAEYKVDQNQLRDDLNSAYKILSLETTGHVRIRKLHPKGSLLYISTAGVYLPFVGEGHIDPGLHPITHSFTMMHEMSHGYGWTGEDVCNFLALLASINSDILEIRYSGFMAYWRYLRSNAYRADKERWQSLEPVVNETVMTDYREVIAYTDRYPDIMPKLRNLIYDNYLKSHGIKEGIVSYSEMIKLAHGWKQKHGSLILKDIGSTK